MAKTKITFEDLTHFDIEDKEFPELEKDFLLQERQGRAGIDMVAKILSVLTYYPDHFRGMSITEIYKKLSVTVETKG